MNCQRTALRNVLVLIAGSVSFSAPLVFADVPPAVAERPRTQSKLTRSQLDQLLRHADVVVDEDANVEQRRKAAIKLGDTPSRFARPALLAALHRSGTDKYIRIYAAHSLSKIPDPCVIGDLIDLLSDEQFDVAAHAAKSLQKITNRRGHQDRLPSDPQAPGRVEIQETWRAWWKLNRDRFMCRHYHPSTDLAQAASDKKPKVKPTSYPVLADYIRERLNSEDKWVYVRDGEVTWSHDRIRWIPLFANPPSVKRTRWLCKPWDKRDDKSVPWREFTSAPGGRPAEGRAGVGSWLIAPEVEFKDGRKVIFENFPEW